MSVAVVAAIAMPLTGDLLAKRAHRHQPAKLAAAEALFETQRRAPFTIGGWPDVERRETRYGIEIPGALSFLSGSSFDTEVIGLDRIPRDQWPNVAVTHAAFQIMVGSGMAMLGAALCYWLVRWRTRRPRRRRCRACSCSRSSCAARSASSPSKPAGSSPRSAASRG